MSTPIGNLKDITLRALETLQSCDYILCEDTRHSQHLLKHYDIQKPLESFHKFNEAAKEPKVLHDLQMGKKIALISDAGTPGISDPGNRLVQKCIALHLKIEVVPGPCALIAALSCSGLPTNRFQFYGFLPRKEGELQNVLKDILSYPSTTVCYESPHRIHHVLKEICRQDANRKIVIARELTKKFEQVIRDRAKEVLERWKELTIKGELVLLIEGNPHASSEAWEMIPLEDHVRFVEDKGRLSRKEAIKKVAEMRGIPKRTVYNSLVKKEDD